MPAHSQTPLTQAMPSAILADISTAHSGIPIGHFPLPVAQTTSNFVESTRFTTLEGMVNQLATNMATNMAELMAIAQRSESGIIELYFDFGAQATCRSKSGHSSDLCYGL
ncbi:hypothetical protein CDL15_Pgr012425 [Punica granatum]|uniref:Uncharacterized protein n=1 Tax=Punica granatum TaxID=22663 RepID=A0A218WYJ9_PUNGR|nr:hypothetical protein CDL15_Pgr012425 [Punica granatum]